jgi:NAD(P)H-flavin reductase
VSDDTNPLFSINTHLAFTSNQFGAKTTATEITMKHSLRYQQVNTVSPMFQIIMQPLLFLVGPLLALTIRMRWSVAHALQIRVIPRIIPPIPLPYLRDLSYLTVGQLLMLSPLIIFVFMGYFLSFVKPDLDRSGQVASYSMYITFLTANKSNNIISVLLGIPFERLITYHKLCSMVAVTLGCLHTYVAFNFGGTNHNSKDDSIYASFGPEPNLVKFLGDGQVNLTGTLLVASLAGSIALSIVPLRRWFFQLWLGSHILLGFTAIVVCFLHDVTTVVFVLLWWVLDLSVRYLLMACARYQVNAEIKLHHSDDEDESDIVEISFPVPDGFSYSPGQFVQIAVPSISLFQFHPVSIASAPHEEAITLRLRGVGDWTDALVEMAAAMKEKTLIFMEGPYGAIAVDLEDTHRYKTILLIGGGIGNTHCESVGKSLLHEHEQRRRRVTKLRYVWSVRRMNMVRDMPPLGGYCPAYSPGSRTRRSTHVTSGTLSTSFESEDLTLKTDRSAGRGVKVEIGVYCTREGLDEEAMNESNAYLVHNLRPDIEAILQEMRREAIEAGESYIAVIGCGPTGMMEFLREACRKYSDSQTTCKKSPVFFELHTEQFEF